MSEQAAFADLLTDAQRVAGMLAARHRGDHDDALTMLRAVEHDKARADAAILLADLLLGLLAHEQNRPVDVVAAELSLQLAQMAA